MLILNPDARFTGKIAGTGLTCSTG